MRSDTNAATRRAALSREMAAGDPRPAVPAWLVPAVHLILLAALTIGYFLTSDGQNVLLMVSCLLVFYAVALPHVIHADVIGVKTVATIPVIFYVFYYILFYFPYQKYVFNVGTLSRSSFVSDTFPQEANKSVLLATMGVLAFDLGYRAFNKMRGMEARTEPRAAHQDVDVSTISAIGLILSISFYVLAGLRSANEGRYTDTSSGGVVAEGVYTIIVMFAMLCLAAAIARTAQGKRLKVMSWVGIGLAIAWSLNVLLVGDRNSFLLIALTGIGGLMTFRYQARRVTLALMIMGALLLYNAVEVVRSSENPSVGAVAEQIFSPQPAAQANSNSSSGTDNSFDITTISLRAAIAAVPSSAPYGYGFYQAVGFAGVLPAVRGLFLGDSLRPTDTSQVLSTYLLAPGATWSVGTNVIADAYIDAGPLGVPVMLFGLGAFAGLMRRKLREGLTSQRIALYLVTLSLWAELPRYSVMFPVRVLVWAWLVFVLARVSIWTFRKHDTESADRTDKPVLAGR